jgi:TonB family protein
MRFLPGFRLLVVLFAWPLCQDATAATSRAPPLPVASYPMSPDLLVGAWSGRDPRGGVRRMVLEADGRADLLNDGRSMAGDTSQGVLTMRYRLDTAHVPAWLDIEARSEKGTVVAFHGIVELRSRNRLRVRFSAVLPRPSAFTNRGTIELSRDTASPASLVMNEAGMSDQLADFDRALWILTGSVERWDGAAGQPVDFRRRTPGDDLARDVLPAELKERLGRMRIEAQRAFDQQDWPGVRIELQPGIVEINAAAERFRAILGYWKHRTYFDRRMRAWKKAVKSNRLPDSHEAEFERLQMELNARIENGDFQGAGTEAFPPLLALFDRAIKEARASAPGGVLIDDPLRRLSKMGCATSDEWTEARAALPVSQRVLPRVDQAASAPTRSYYPMIAAMLDIQGTIVVRVFVSETGCPVWAETEKSSGSPMLDDAGLDWVVDGARYIPGSEAGVPRAMPLVFNVNFKLLD